MGNFVFFYDSGNSKGVVYDIKNAPKTGIIHPTHVTNKEYEELLRGTQERAMEIINRYI